MAKIKIKQGDGAEPGVLAQAIIQGQKFPFVAKIKHAGYKPIVVPSTGLGVVIKPGEELEFKVKSFEQAWLLVTDSATLAQRWEYEAPAKVEGEGESEVHGFVTITVPDVAKPEAVAEVPAVAEEAAAVDTTTKPTGKGTKTAAVASE